jgi:single-strand DNA-binding protein
MNSITVSGTVGNAELKYLQSGDPVLAFSVADGQGKDKPTIWWNCSIFGKRAESLANYVQKGGKVTVVGTVSEDQYTDKNGNDKKAMKVRVSDIALQGGKEQAEEPRRAAPAPAAQAEIDDDGSDIPF